MGHRAIDAVEFRVSIDPDWPTEVEPIVGGVALRELVAVYEREQGYEPSGGYGGLVPAHFKSGDLTAYFRGERRRPWRRVGRASLLGCVCGEVGCWPLEARVTATDEAVAWSDFRQPHRQNWTYEGFGPFTFDRPQYESAIADAMALLRDGEQ